MWPSDNYCGDSSSNELKIFFAKFLNQVFEFRICLLANDYDVLLALYIDTEFNFVIRILTWTSFFNMFSKNI